MQVIEVVHQWAGRLTPRSVTRRIVVHHAASAGDVDAATVHQWHLANGWAGIGYHFLVRMNGSIERGRPENVVGAHAKGANGDSIGICLAGNIDKTPPTAPQMASLLALIRELFTCYGQLTVIRHMDVNPTTCPGRYFPWSQLQAELAPKPPPPIQQRIRLVFRGQPAGEGYLIESTSFVPVRFFAEALGLKVRWDAGTVFIE